MGRVVFLALVAVSWAGVCSAEPWPAGLPACPASGQPTRFYPQAGAEKSSEGDVELSCIVGGDGRYQTCSVTSETPAGLNFGNAALLLAKCETGVVGNPGDAVRLPVHYRLPESADPRPVGGVTVTARGHWEKTKKRR